MWTGVLPAVTSHFTGDERLDHEAMRRAYARLMATGCDGLVACGSLGEGNMLTPEERLEVLAACRDAAGRAPVLMTVSEPGTREACAFAAAAARAGADGLMVVPSPLYHNRPHETVATLKAVARAGGVPVMIYSNRVAYRVDVTPDVMEALADEPLFVAIKESSDDVRRTTEIINRFGDRFAVLTGVDNLAFEALAAGAVGWVAGLALAFPEETVAVYRLMRAGRLEEARLIYRWFRPLLDLDVSTLLVQNIKLAEAMTFGASERVRAPRMPLDGAERARVEAIITAALASRPVLPAP